MSDSVLESSRFLDVRREDDLLFLELNDPQRANALSPEMIAAASAVYSRDLRADGVRAVILSGSGKHFSAGADLEHLRSLGAAGYDENLADSERLRALFESILRQSALTVAVVQGACVAGGCGLATAHDFVVADENSRFLYSEVRIGFVAALVATFLPLRLKGRDIREVLLNPDFIEADRALDIGLVNRVVPAAELATRARELAVEILERASSESIARTKKLLLDALGLGLGEALELAARVNAEARGTDDCKHGIATFLETESAAFLEIARNVNGGSPMRLILFDIDGTLLDCGSQVKVIFARALDEVFGTAGAIDEYDFAGRTDDRIATDLLRQAGVSDERIGEGLPRMKERYFRDLDEGLDRASMRVLPGVLTTLETLAAEPAVRVGLLTGNWEQGARIKLGRVGLNRYFPFGAFGDDVNERDEMPPLALKTASDLFERSFGPADAVIVGDTERDVDCARAHGIGSIGVTTGRHSADQLAAAGADRIVRSLGEIL